MLPPPTYPMAEGHHLLLRRARVVYTVMLRKTAGKHYVFTLEGAPQHSMGPVRFIFS